MALYQKYYGFKKSFEQSITDEKRYKKYITMLNEMANDRMIVGEVLDAAVKKYNRFVNDKISFEENMKAFFFFFFIFKVFFFVVFFFLFLFFFFTIILISYV